MTGVWRVILFIYSLFLVAFSIIALLATMSKIGVLDAISGAASSSETKFIIAGMALLLLVFSIVTLFYSIGPGSAPRSKTIMITSGIAGEISITIPAVKVIIMKAVRTVEGIKDVRATVGSKPEGVEVHIHTMINPEYNIPEMSERIQSVVRQQLEEIGGLKVEAVKVLIDDFTSPAKVPGN